MTPRSVWANMGKLWILVNGLESIKNMYLAAPAQVLKHDFALLDAWLSFLVREISARTVPGIMWAAAYTHKQASCIALTTAALFSRERF